VREGEEVEAKQPLFELHADDLEHLVRGRDTIKDAYVIGDEPFTPSPLLIERIEGN
jgi:thymidine phosphorylase